MTGTRSLVDDALFGRRKEAEYTSTGYHKPSDHVDSAWDLTGYAEHAKLLIAIRDRVANAEQFPQRKFGNEFRRYAMQ